MISLSILDHRDRCSQPYSDLRDNLFGGCPVSVVFADERSISRRGARQCAYRPVVSLNVNADRCKGDPYTLWECWKTSVVVILSGAKNLAHLSYNNLEILRRSATAGLLRMTVVDVFQQPHCTLCLACMPRSKSSGRERLSHKWDFSGQTNDLS